MPLWRAGPYSWHIMPILGKLCIFDKCSSFILKMSFWKSGTNGWHSYAIKNNYGVTYFTEMNSSWSELSISGPKSGIPHANFENENMPSPAVGMIYMSFFSVETHLGKAIVCCQNIITFQKLDGSEQLMFWAFQNRSQKWILICHFGERELQSWAISKIRPFSHWPGRVIERKKMLSYVNE